MSVTSSGAAKEMLLPQERVFSKVCMLQLNEQNAA
jgi:hypothetical protein